MYYDAKLLCRCRPFYSIVLKSIVEEAKILGYSSIMHYFEDANMDIPECILERKVAGILIVGKNLFWKSKNIKNTGIPIVLS